MSPETFHIESQNSGCFHFESVVVDIALYENSANLRVSRTANGKSIAVDKKEIAHPEARRIVDRFLQILGTRQRLSDSRSTTVYKAHAVWTVGTTRNEWTSQSSEITAEDMDGLLAGKLDPQLKQKVQEARVDYFNVAHELHRAAMSLAQELQT